MNIKDIIMVILGSLVMPAMFALGIGVIALLAELPAIVPVILSALIIIAWLFGGSSGGRYGNDGQN